MLANTGNLFNFGESRDIPKILKDIGLGASLFLLTLKAFAWFFFILSIINLPLFLLYTSGNEAV